MKKQMVTHSNKQAGLPVNAQQGFCPPDWKDVNTLNIIKSC